MRFTGKVAIVTGSAHGQGALEAAQLVAEGARVLIADIDEDAGREQARRLGNAAEFVRLDVTSEADWARTVACAESLGGPDALVNNAGIFRPERLTDTSVKSFMDHVSVNQLGTFLGMRAVADAMRRLGGGAIVNISSTASLHGAPGLTAYGATKWAVRGMTRIAAAEFGPWGIRVNSVSPGLVETEMTRFISDGEFETYRAALPLQRLARPKDVCDSVLFLLSDAARSITGADVKVDAGAVL